MFHLLALGLFQQLHVLRRGEGIFLVLTKKREEEGGKMTNNLATVAEAVTTPK